MATTLKKEKSFFAVHFEKEDLIALAVEYIRKKGEIINNKDIKNVSISFSSHRDTDSYVASISFDHEHTIKNI